LLVFIWCPLCSCVPNAQIEFDLKNRGAIAVVRARRKIKRGYIFLAFILFILTLHMLMRWMDGCHCTGTGEQLFNSYLGYAASGGEVATVSERAQRLSTYGFRCRCKLCTTQEANIDKPTQDLLADLGLL
jgi:hypothetical protein